MRALKVKNLFGTFMQLVKCLDMRRLHKFIIFRNEKVNGYFLHPQSYNLIPEVNVHQVHVYFLYDVLFNPREDGSIKEFW